MECRAGVGGDEEQFQIIGICWGCISSIALRIKLAATAFQVMYANIQFCEISHTPSIGGTYLKF